MFLSPYGQREFLLLLKTLSWRIVTGDCCRLLQGVTKNLRVQNPAVFDKAGVHLTVFTSLELCPECSSCYVEFEYYQFIGGLCFIALTL
jgi:hypothetical protein